MPTLGCIADDYTGGSDLANNLTRQGLRTTLMLGLPTNAQRRRAEEDAVVIALKSRTVPAAQAIDLTLAALRFLQLQHCERFYFKYCSTFDSTAQGNIGPVTDALLEALGASGTILCPAFPDAGRTVYQGHLFVHDALLSESGMQHHPLTPMRDANLVRVLQAQTPSHVGLLSYHDLQQGPHACHERLRALRRAGTRLVVCDTLDNGHLRTLALATQQDVLITGGSGLALGLPSPSRREAAKADQLPPARGAQVILAGSASRATLAQIEHARTIVPTRRLDALELHATYEGTLQQTVDWARPHLGRTPVLIYASGTAEEIHTVHAQLGREQSGALIERALGELAVRLTQLGARQLIVAGGETSGAVTQALGVQVLRVGPELSPGVPWTYSESPSAALHLVLKSGNFGPVDLFTAAWELIA